MTKTHQTPPLPNSADAERFLLAALSLAPERLSGLSIGATDFYTPGHAALFAAFKKVITTGARPDLATVLNALGSEAEQFRDTVIDVLAVNATGASIASYASTVRSLADRRRMILDLEEKLAALRAGAEMSNGHRQRRQSRFTATELVLEEFAEPRYAVSEIIPEGLSLLVAAPKFGKSWLALGTGVAIAGGGTAFGKIRVDKGTVLVLALEDSPRRLQARLMALLGDDEIPDGLHLWTELADIADVERFLVEHPDCRLVVVDVLAKVRPAIFKGESSYAADYRALEQWKDLADRHSVAVLVLHHDRKAESDDFVDSVSGTNGLAGCADTIIALGRSRMTGTAVMKITGRDIPESEHALEFDPITGQWTLLDGPALNYQVADTRRLILEKLTDECDTPSKLSKAIGVRHDLVRQTLRRMVDDGHVVTTRRGHYKTLSQQSLVTNANSDSVTEVTDLEDPS